MDIYNNDIELPLGLGMAFAQNKNAMDRFARLAPAEQEKVMEKAKTANSKGDVQSIIDSLES